MIYIGIDPGKNGGIAIIDDYFKYRTYVYPFSEETLVDKLNGLICDDACFCVLEQVHAMPKQGLSSTFNFGRNYGFIQGVLKTYRIPFELVSPQKWKKEFSCTSDKNMSIDVCRRLFPNANLKASERCKKDHDGMAEALLMAEYGRRHYHDKS